MSLPQRSARAGRPSSRLTRATVVGAMALGLVTGAAGCSAGMNVQTLNPYTPTEGVNTDVGPVMIRNLTIVSKAAGSGILSASLISTKTDSLSTVTGSPVKADGSLGPAFTAKLTKPVSVGPKLLVLTEQPPITITSPDLQPGLTAKVTLTFAQAGPVTSFVTIVDADQGGYQTATPGATPSGTITPSK